MLVDLLSAAETPAVQQRVQLLFHVAVSVWRRQCGPGAVLSAAGTELDVGGGGYRSVVGGGVSQWRRRPEHTGDGRRLRRRSGTHGNGAMPSRRHYIGIIYPLSPRRPLREPVFLSLSAGSRALTAPEDDRRRYPAHGKRANRHWRGWLAAATIRRP